MFNVLPLVSLMSERMVSLVGASGQRKFIDCMYVYVVLKWVMALARVNVHGLCERMLETEFMSWKSARNISSSIHEELFINSTPE